MAASPFFARFRMALVFALGLVAVGTVWLARREPWHSLPSGGEIRLVKVAYTDSLELSDPGFRLDDLRDWLGPNWSRLLGPYPTSGSTGFGGPTLVFAFYSRGRNGELAFTKARCEIDLPSGQTLLGQFNGGGGSVLKMTEIAQFRLTPFSERRLQVRIEVDGQTLRFDVPNPAFRKKTVVWKEEPRPPTHTVDGVTIRLERVVGEWADDPFWGSAWSARADFSAYIGGQGAGDWVDTGGTFFDPLGNESQNAVLFSEPVWKVHAWATKNERFPFPDADITWMGRVALPDAGEVRIVSPAPDLLALLGPGHYHAAAGQVTAIPTPPDAKPGTPIRFYDTNSTGNNGRGEYIEVDVEGIQLLHLPGPRGLGGGTWGECHVFARDDAGHRVPFKHVRGVAETSLLIAPLPPGTREVEIGRIRVPYLETDFYIHAPLPPLGKKPAGKVPR